MLSKSEVKRLILGEYFKDSKARKECERLGISLDILPSRLHEQDELGKVLNKFSFTSEAFHYDSYCKDHPDAPECKIYDS